MTRYSRDRIKSSGIERYSDLEEGKMYVRKNEEETQQWKERIDLFIRKTHSATAVYYQTCDSQSNIRICRRQIIIADYHRRFYSLPGVALVSEFDLENGIRQEKHMSIKLE